MFFAITMSAIGVSQSAGLTPDLTKVKVAVNSIFELLDRQSKIDPLEKSGKTLQIVRGDVELQHVSFTYPTRPDVPIFRDLNLLVRAGQVSHLYWKIAFQKRCGSIADAMHDEYSDFLLLVIIPKQHLLSVLV